MTFAQKIQVLAASLICAGSGLNAVAAPLPIPEPPDFVASSYMLMDYHSGQILAAHDPDKRVEPASITKLMTAYIVFDVLKKGEVKPDDLVTVSEKAWKAIGSRMFIEVGNQVPVSELLQGMIVQSGNDASIALAEHVAGGENSFAGWMNQYAERLGMLNTQYQNATGLPDDNHYSTAADIALLARSLITEFPEHYKLYSQKDYSYNGIKQPNRNRLLWRDSSVDGMKTGFTDAAGYCLVSSAERDGMRLIAVVLGTPSDKARISSSEALLNYGFRFFETLRVAGKGQPMAQARVWKGATEQLDLGTARAVYVTIPRGRKDGLQLKPDLPGRVIAPVLSGQSVGKLQISHEGKVLRSEPLAALNDVPLGGLLQRLADEVMLFFKR